MEFSLEKGEEYSFFIYLIDVIKEALQTREWVPNTFGDVDPDFLNKTFFGAEPSQILREKDSDKFPDIAPIREDQLIIFDVVKIDGSKPATFVDDKPKGSSYQEALGKSKKDPKYRSRRKCGPGNQALKQLIKEYDIEFSPKHLEANFVQAISKKISKIEGYKGTINEYLQTEGDAAALRDRCKPKHVWLVVADLTPTDLTPSKRFPSASKEFLQLMEDHRELEGIIYTHIVNPFEPRFLSEDVVFFKNDKWALDQLKEL